MSSPNDTLRNGTRAWLTSPGTPLSADIVEPASSPETPLPEDDPAEWNAMRLENPRLHDGGILRVVAFDPHTHRFRVAPAAYRDFALQERRLARTWATQPPSVPRRFDPSLVWLLGVKGFIIGKDCLGSEYLLIARRAGQTRVYPSLWEAAPAGGIDLPSLDPHAPAASLDAFNLHDRVLHTLRNEAHEELGLPIDVRDAFPVVVVQDSIARSFDIFVRLDLTGVADPRQCPTCFTAADRWEYIDAAWLARADAASFASTGALSPPTLAALRPLGWID